MEPDNKPDPQHVARWRHTLYEVIFEAETPAGKVFDIALLVIIILSVVAVMLESVPTIPPPQYHDELHLLEWLITVLFTVEYILRILCVRIPSRYVTSFFGIVDLLAILPSYISLFVAGTQYLLVIRMLRLLRIFRIFKLTRYVSESHILITALRASRTKITVFLFSVLIIVTIVGSLMYLIEGPEHGFTSIPTSVYWAIVTLTTVGFGDIAPTTAPGRLLASCLMITGYGIIAVPTGIVTVELYQAAAAAGGVAPATGEIRSTRLCPVCHQGGHDEDARHCKHCGAAMAG